MELKFEQTTVDIGTIQQKQENIPVKWVITQGVEEIDGFKAGCGCTANVRQVGNTIIADYNDNTNDSAFAEDKDTVQISKTVHVFLKDGEPLKVENERGVKHYNANKSRKTLTFNAEVVRSGLLTSGD